jgi:hypothetical protein
MEPKRNDDGWIECGLRFRAHIPYDDPFQDEYEKAHPFPKSDDIYNDPDVDAWIEAETEAKREYFRKNFPSFCSFGLNNPGTLIEISDEEGTVQLLIGDINPRGNAGEDEEADWNRVQSKTIIQRYKVIWQVPE